MSKGIKKIWSVFTTLIVAAALLIALLLAGVRLIGLNVYVVLSGSMEPTYHTGSIIYVKKTDPFTLKTGDVITFMLDEDTLATHRIVGIVPDEDDPSVIRFRTKGDANASEDGSLVHYKNVVGTPVFTIPKLGYVADYIQHPPGLYVTIAVGAFLMLLMFMPELIDAIKDDNKPKKEKALPEKKPKKKKRSGAVETGREKPLREETAVDTIPADTRKRGQKSDARASDFVADEPEIPEEKPIREQYVRPRGSHESFKGSHEAVHSTPRRGGAHVKGRHEK